MKIYIRLIKYLLDHKLRISIAVVCLFLVAFLNVFSIAAFKPVIEILFGVTEQKATAETAALTACPAGTPHIIYPLQTPSEDVKSANGTMTLCPYGPPHAISPITSPPGQEEHAQNQLAAQSERAGPLQALYAKANAIKIRLEQSFHSYIQQGKKLFLLAIIAGIILVAQLLKFLFDFLSKYLSNYVSLSIIKDLKYQLYSHVLHLDMGFFARKTTGHLMARISSDVQGVRNSLMLVFDDAMQAPINLAFLLAFLFYLNYRLTLLILIFVPLTIVPINYFAKKVRKLTKKERKKVASISSAMQEILSGVKIVKAFRMEDYELKKFDRQNVKHFLYELRRRTVKILSSPFMELLGTLAVVLVLLVGGYFITEARTMSGSDFFIYIFALSRLYRPVKQINGAFADVQEGMANAERIFRILDTHASVKEIPNAIELRPMSQRIRFHNVSFAYEDDKYVLKNINLELPVRQVTAFVGPSGAGKSTLISLLPRFYDPAIGSVDIDGVDIKDVTFDSLRHQIGIVSQESILFNDTLRNNIAYGKEDTPDNLIIAAAKAAHIHDHISSLPQGYDTIIGERGTRLSGGERQRITIARAILKDPAILILDEATSSLDSESEALIQKALDQLISSRTTLVIAHRLSTVMNADRIVVMDKGRIVEIGKHDELITKGGLYARLCESQFQLRPLRTPPV